VTAAAVALFVVIVGSVVVAFMSTVRIALTICGPPPARPLFIFAAAVVVGAAAGMARSLIS